MTRPHLSEMVMIASGRALVMGLVLPVLLTGCAQPRDAGGGTTSGSAASGQPPPSKTLVIADRHKWEMM